MTRVILVATLIAILVLMLDLWHEKVIFSAVYTVPGRMCSRVIVTAFYCGHVYRRLGLLCQTEVTVTGGSNLT